MARGPTRRYGAGSPAMPRRSGSSARGRNGPRPGSTSRSGRSGSWTSEKVEIAPPTLLDRRRGALRGRPAPGMGDPVGAWGLLRAVVRTSRHMERVEPSIRARTSAIILVQFARDRHRVGRGPGGRGRPAPQGPGRPGRRRGAHAAGLAHLSRGIPGRLRFAGGPAPGSASGPGRPRTGPFPRFARAVGLDRILEQEPERSRRILRLLIANDLAWCDRPPSERPGSRSRSSGSTITTPPRRRPRGPPARGLARWAESALIAAPPWRTGRDRELGQERPMVDGPAQGGRRRRPVHEGGGPAPHLAGRGVPTLSPDAGRLADRDEAEPIPR